jgi:ankyrin repeat protein
LELYEGPIPELTSRTLFFYASVLGFHDQLRIWAADRRNILHMDVDTLAVTAQVDDIESLKILVAAGADPDSPDGEGTTPLMTAISCGHFQVARYLVEEAGANVQAENAEGQDAMMIAIIQGSEEAVSLLLDQGFDLSKSRSRKEGLTPIDSAPGL